MSGDHLSQPCLSPNRNGEQVAKWVFDVASKRTDAEFELVDLLDYPLPHLDEPAPAVAGPGRRLEHGPCAAAAARRLRGLTGRSRRACGRRDRAARR